MKKQFILRNLLYASSIFIINFCSAQTPSTDPHWILNQNLSDEFSYTGSNASIINQMRNKWHFLIWEINPSCNAYTQSLLGSPVIQSWGYVNTDGSDIEVNNGICTLSAKFAPGYYEWPSTDTINHPFHFPVYYYYTRCQLVSLASMHYGFYELKFRLPHYQNHPEYLDGIGANMWFTQESASSPALGVDYSELDVFEQAPLNQYIFAPNYTRR
ncbi:MAG: hypothetical protein IT247_02585 [Bacteroidia bacterium]|nr:hypothetical protein [Bacteroidia bacterium]